VSQTGGASGREEGGILITDLANGLDRSRSRQKIVILPAENGRCSRNISLQKTPGEVADTNIEGEDLNGFWHLIFYTGTS
jgi:hypothetical protein